MNPLSSFRVFFATALAKLSYRILTCWRPGTGTSLPGRLALALDPSLLGHLSQQQDRDRQKVSTPPPRLAVTGTNGKTTTSGLLASLLNQTLHPQNGQRIIHNHLGANMVPGITAALALETNDSGHLPNNSPTVLEVDEASLSGLTRAWPVDELVVTNLFRDQLDRYGELDTTARMIAAAFPGVTRRIWLNGDDPLVASLADQAPAGVEVATFGLRSLPEGTVMVGAGLDIGPGFPQEVTDCPRCGAPLRYGLTVYGHLGDYDCPACGYARPTPDVVADVLALTPVSTTVRIEVPRFLSKPLLLTLNLPGLFNLYNLLAALSVGLACGVTANQVPRALEAYQGVFGRAEVRTLAGKTTRVFLIKNPVGAGEVIRLVAQDPAARLLIALNDDYADGRDISWLWDAPFEWLAALPARQIVVSGRRAEDMTVRLKYAGLDPTLLVVEPDLLSALKQALATTAEGETLYILPTYTALLALRFLWDKV